MKHKVTKSKKAAILVHLPDVMKAKVARLAKEQNRSMSAYVRVAILRQFIKEDQSNG